VKTAGSIASSSELPRTVGNVNHRGAVHRDAIIATEITPVIVTANRDATALHGGPNRTIADHSLHRDTGMGTTVSELTSRWFMIAWAIRDKDSWSMKVMVQRCNLTTTVVDRVSTNTCKLGTNVTVREMTRTAVPTITTESNQCGTAMVTIDGNQEAIGQLPTIATRKVKRGALV
jgi:hypothetical protein